MNILRVVRRYFTLWFLFAKHELLFQFSSKSTMLFFFIGKLIRFTSLMLILIMFRLNTKGLAGYSIDEVIVFFLTFNLIDIISQMVFRGVYSLSGKVRTGEFDFFLMRPVNPLFRSLTGQPDFNDLLMFVPLIGFTVWYISRALPTLSIAHILLYLLLLGNGLIIAAAFHIFVICIGVVSTEVDNTITLYRDLSQMGRFPMEIYREPLRGILTFIVPIGIMMAVPAKALLGLLSPQIIVISFAISITMFLLALFAWDRSLKSYASASS